MSKQKSHLTLSDVAKAAGVSPMTVSRVINGKKNISEHTRSHVLQVMRNLGYRPNRVARSLATDRTQTIGIVVPTISSTYYGLILEGFETVLRENNYHLLVCNTGQNAQREEEIIRLLEEYRVDGIFLMASYLPDAALGQALKQLTAIVYNSEVAACSASRIQLDEQQGMQLALAHLVKIGCRRIGYIGPSDENRAGRQRRQFFTSTLEEMLGQPADIQHLTRGTDNWEDGRDRGFELLEEHPDVDGIVCFNDYIAAGVLQACMQLGRKVPDEIAITGFDDSLIAPLSVPPLTTVRLTMPPGQLGILAANKLLDRIKNDTQPETIVIQRELVIRESAPALISQRTSGVR